MTIFQAFILGIVQGITEFLPISSSGHLVLIPQIFGWDLQPTSFDIMLHAATLGAILLYFRRDIWEIIQKVLQRNYSLTKNIIISSVPAAIIGILFSDFIDDTFKNDKIIVVSLISVGIVMVFIEPLIKSSKLISTEKMPAKNALLVGVFQCLAYIRGISRSGITIIGGLLAGLSVKEAARYSFLIGIPIIAAAAAKQLVDLDLNEAKEIGIISLFVGFISSFASGILSIKFLLKFLENKGLALFGIYRIALGLILLLFVL